MHIKVNATLAVQAWLPRASSNLREVLHSKHGSIYAEQVRAQQHPTTTAMACSGLVVCRAPPETAISSAAVTIVNSIIQSLGNLGLSLQLCSGLVRGHQCMLCMLCAQHSCCVMPLAITLGACYQKPCAVGLLPTEQLKCQQALLCHPPVWLYMCCM
jgi:hypothetical protein